MWNMILTVSLLLQKRKDKSYSKNRVLRVLDTFAENIRANFPPNKYNNNETGWDIMDGYG